MENGPRCTRNVLGFAWVMLNIELYPQKIWECVGFIVSVEFDRVHEHIIKNRKCRSAQRFTFAAILRQKDDLHKVHFTSGNELSITLTQRDIAMHVYNRWPCFLAPRHIPRYRAKLSDTVSNLWFTCLFWNRQRYYIWYVAHIPSLWTTVGSI